VFLLTIDWGDVPTWISALTTTGALIAAGWIVGIELRRDWRSGERLARAEQADLVAAWRHQEDASRVQLKNASHLPVYNFSIEFSSVELDKRFEATLPLLPPGEHTLKYPPEIVHVTARHRLVDLDLRDQYAIRITFTDSADRTWRRDEYGVLEPA
jgi:hypothetical protein